MTLLLIAVDLKPPSKFKIKKLTQFLIEFISIVFDIFFLVYLNMAREDIEKLFYTTDRSYNVLN